MQFTKIKNLVAGQKNVFIKDCGVLETGGIEIYERMEGQPKVCNGIIKDDTGQIKISAWGHLAPILNESKIVDVENCFCKEYNGELNLSTGKFGRLKVIKRKEKQNE